MDPTEIALQAARRLSVDVANLSYRLAVLESEREALHQSVMGLTPGTWTRTTRHVHPQEGTDVESVLTIAGDEATMVEMIIQALQALV
jgi:hypothetical protein